MIRRLTLATLLLALTAACGDAGSGDANGIGNEAAAPASVAAPSPAATPLPDEVRVRLETGAGPIVIAIDAKRAPLTAANFVRYVDEKRLDGTSFYRAAPTKGAEERGFVQGGIRRSYRLMLPPIAHEPTTKTGLKHEAGTVSMARAEEGAGAMGDFFILTAAMPAMDAKGAKQGYAAFGRVVEGMDLVRRILAAPRVENAGRGAMRGQMLAEPVPIVSARRVD
jgi:peptidyl-prolyl cis-trans isomerase A (cyclophilin A)